MRTLGAVLALLVVLVAGGLAAANLVFDHANVERHTVAQAVREIVVRSDSGDVTLVRGRRIAVRETQHYVFEKPMLELDVDAGVLTLDSRCDATSLITCYADLRVTVPPGVRVRVKADSGDVDVRRVDVREARLNSDSGDLRLELVGRQRLVRAHSDSGDVDLAATQARDVDAQSDSGDVVVVGAHPRRILAASDSGDVTVVVPAGAYAVDAQTDSGDVKIDGISRNDGAARSIEAQTDSGDVTLRGDR